MTEQEFKEKTKQLAIKIVAMLNELPKNATAEVFKKQLLRSATSVGANYRAACRSQSTADMIAKLKIVEEEADESLYWIELLVETEMLPKSEARELWSEMNEVVAMTVASIKTLRSKQYNRKSKI